MTDKTINLHPYHCEFKPDGDGFVLEFLCGTNCERRIKARIHFRFWWVGFLARELWKAIRTREQEVESAKKAMTP